MKKLMAMMVVALLLGGCGDAAAEAAGTGKTGVEDLESAVGENVGALNEEKTDVADGGPEEDGGADVKDGNGEDEAAAGRAEEENKETEAGHEEGGSGDTGPEAGNDGKDSEEEGSGIKEVRKPQLADYEITVFGETEAMYVSGPVNVRKGPAVDFDRVGGLARGQEVTVTGQADTGWYEIVYDGEKAYVSGRYLQKEKPEDEPAAQPDPSAETQDGDQAQASAENPSAQMLETSQAAETQPAVQETAEARAADQLQAAETQAQAAVQEVKNVAGVIMVGDSRFVQMQQNIGENSCTWIAENGKGYNWFNETAVAKIDGCVGKGSKVLINLGVNDPGHVNDYLELVNAKAAEWAGKGATVYYASVNPVWENPYTTEEQVEYFNSQMQAGLSGNVHWIDSHSYLTSIGYKLVDGLHYNAETYQNIYAYFMSCL